MHEPALDNSTDPSSHSKAPTSKAENATMESAQSDPSEQVDVHKSSTAQDAQSSEVADPTTAETDRSSKQVQSDSGELVDGELQESPAALSREAQIAPMAEDVVSAEQVQPTLSYWWGMAHMGQQATGMRGCDYACRGRGGLPASSREGRSCLWPLKYPFINFMCRWRCKMQRSQLI